MMIVNSRKIIQLKQHSTQTEGAGRRVWDKSESKRWNILPRKEIIQKQRKTLEK
jgi:hypothetical protein